MSAARISPTAILFALIVSLAGAETARAGSGRLMGTITAGPQAAPIANARVSLRAEPPPRGDASPGASPGAAGGADASGEVDSARSDADGQYAFAPLPAGVAYAVTVEARGLRTLTRTGVILRDGETTRVDIRLEIADVRDAVLVPGAIENLRDAAAGVSQTVEARDIRDLPSVTRSTTKYALLDPHVRQAIGLGADFQDSTRLSINAGSYRHTGYMLDGASTYDWIYANSPQVSVSPGAIADMEVLTGQYAAQYGQSTTGVLSMTTASGGDRYAGEGFVYLRPSGSQARPPLSSFRVPNERTTGGFHAGGPLARAGGGAGESRSSFFGSYERMAQDRGAYIQSPVAGFFIGHTTEQSGLFRVDHRLTDEQQLTLRVNASESTSDNANDRVAGFNQASFGRTSQSQSVGGQVTQRAILGGAVNELRVSFVAYTPDSATPLESSVQVVRPNYSTEGFSTTNWVHARTWQIGDQVTLSRGRHLLKAGGEIGRLRARDYSFTPYGTYTFASGAPQAGEHPVTFSQTFGAVDLRYGQTQGSAFVQDELRVAPRLTASLGLRYEAQSVTDARLNFAPRTSVAWDVEGDGRTLVRGGAGLFYDQYYMYLTRRFTTLGPQSPQATYSWSWGDPGFPSFPDSFASAPSGKLAGARDIMIPGDTLRNPRSRQLSIGFERDLGAGLRLTVSGLHAKTVDQMRVNDINHPAPFARTEPGQVRTTQAANASRPYTTFEGVAVRDIAKVENTAESTYRALDLGLARRAGGWGRFGVRYVWSSSVAYSMFYADANSGVPDEWWDQWDRFERGPSDFHQPHRLVSDASLNLPLDARLALVITAASGLPVNPITGRDNNGDSYTVDRPIGAARNSFRGPRQVNVDLAVSKSIALTSRLRAELRIEAFNLLNRQNFIKVNNIYGEGPAPLATFLAPVAGITNADPARQLQFAVRVRF
jgi:outer membrane receptor protein involved in Fe transport